VIRLRWIDPQLDDPSAPVDWRLTSLVTSSLFLNFVFWFIADRRQPGRSPVWLLLTGAVCLVVLFYAGPAMSAQRWRRSLFEVAADSLGAITAFGFRMACATFLSIWIAKLVTVIVTLSSTWMHVHPAGIARQRLLSVALVAFLFATSFEGLRINARLASLGDKVALALLAVAFIRVRAGLPSAWRATSHLDVFDAWQYLSTVLYCGTADFACFRFWKASARAAGSASDRPGRASLTDGLDPGCGYLPVSSEASAWNGEHCCRTVA
jgi:hypothetical protein